MPASKFAFGTEAMNSQGEKCLRSRFRNGVHMLTSSGVNIIRDALPDSFMLSAPASVTRLSSPKEIKIEPRNSGERIAYHRAGRKCSLLRGNNKLDTGRQCHLFADCLIKSVVEILHLRKESVLSFIANYIYHGRQYLPHICVRGRSPVNSTQALD